MALPPGGDARRAALAKKVQPHERRAVTARDAYRAGLAVRKVPSGAGDGDDGVHRVGGTGRRTGACVTAGRQKQGFTRPTMRHCPSSLQIASLTRSMQRPTPIRCLVCSSGANQAEAARSSRALGAAVSTAAIATPADRELASAIATGADDEPVTAARSRNWHESEGADGASRMEAVLLSRLGAGSADLFTGER
jgi:hypothetical protein